jgi:hypothetical protein
MLTRKHFESQAEILKRIKDKPTRTLMAAESIKLFEKENPRFDKARFLKACDL